LLYRQRILPVAFGAFNQDLEDLTMPLHPIAIAAHRAATHWNICGAYAARRYAERHGVPSGILTLARVLACAERNSIGKD